MRGLDVGLDRELRPDVHRLGHAVRVLRLAAAGGFDRADLAVLHVHAEVDAVDGGERVRDRRRQQRERLRGVLAVGGHGVDLLAAFAGVGHVRGVIELEQMLAERGIIREQAARAVGAAVFQIDRTVVIIQPHAVFLDAEDRLAVRLGAEQMRVGLQRLVAEVHLHGGIHIQLLAG